MLCLKCPMYGWEDANRYTLYLPYEIRDSNAFDFASVLLDFEREFQEKNESHPIKIIINSKGGSLYSALGIFDTIDFVSYTIETECTGLAASAAALILVSGKKGHRYAKRDSKILIHYAYTTDDITNDNITNELTSLNNEILDTFSERTNKTKEEIRQAIDNVNGELWLTAEEALEFGIIDKIID